MSTIIEQVREILKTFAPERAHEIQIRMETERAVLIKQFAEIDKTQLKEWTENSKEVNAASAAWESLTKKAQAAQNEAQRAYSHRSQMDFSHRNQKAQISAQLRETAPGCFREFANEVQAKMEALRHLPRGEEQIGYDRHGNPVLRPLLPTVSLVQRRAVLLADYQWAMEGGPLECATEVEALAAIEKRRSNWPQIVFEAAR